MTIHRCPVCGAAHVVHPILHALSYGRPRPCSPRCKDRFPRVVGSRILSAIAADRGTGVESGKTLC